MTLTTRLTAFFLAALALVLAAFSLTLYSLARTHLYRQLDDRAAATLETLVAAAEVEPDGLEWDRKERTLWLPRGEDRLAWAVYDRTGFEVDGELVPGQPLRDGPPPGEDDAVVRSDAIWAGEQWRVYRRTHSHPRPDVIERRAVAGATRRPAEERYQSLTFAVASPVVGVRRTLTTLVGWLLGVSAGTWLAAAIGGRWACRRALLPLNRIAARMTEVTAHNLAARLPVPAIRDELTALATAFNDLLGRLDVAFEQQKRFTAEAAHQLRTPLTVVLGQVEVALRRDREPEEYRRALRTAKTHADRLRDVVESLLFLAQADADTRPPTLERIELARWLRDHIQAAWSDHPRSANIVTALPAADAPTARVHPALLAQAFDNLVDNAMKYSPAGTPVRIGLHREAEEVIIAVEDRGDGIRNEDLCHIFEPFFRSPEARRQGAGGVGLGLSVTARIVRCFGGRMSVQSRQGVGSKFSIHLPIPADATSEARPY